MSNQVSEKPKFTPVPQKKTAQAAPQEPKQPAAEAPKPAPAAPKTVAKNAMATEEYQKAFKNADLVADGKLRNSEVNLYADRLKREYNFLSGALPVDPKNEAIIKNKLTEVNNQNVANENLRINFDQFAKLNPDGNGIREEDILKVAGYDGNPNDISIADLVYQIPQEKMPVIRDFMNFRPAFDDLPVYR